MRMIGLLGGTSWESTSVYYTLLNRGAAERLGQLHQPPLLLHSFDFREIADLQAADEWDLLGERYSAATRGLVASGAEVLGICANTMHLVADDVRDAAGGATLVHVVDASVEGVRSAGGSRVALLGTAYTMEKPFYADALRAHGLDVVVPEAEDRVALQALVYGELTQGIVTAESRTLLLRIIGRCSDAGADVALLACTELQMLVAPGDQESSLPLVDTTSEHCRALLDAALR